MAEECGNSGKQSYGGDKHGTDGRYEAPKPQPETKKGETKEVKK